MKEDKLSRLPTETALAGRTYPIITNFLIDLSEGKLLDIGQAKGDLSYRLYHMGFDVYSCDLQKPLWKEIKWKKVDLNEGKLPYETNSFDVAVFSEVMEHLENPRKIIQEIGRIVKKGGIIVMSTPHLLSLPQRLYYFFTGKFLHFQYPYKKYGHKTPMSLHMIKDECNQIGIKILDIKYDRGFIPFLRINLSPSYWFGDTIMIKAKKIN